jgi:cell division protein FtsB
VARAKAEQQKRNLVMPGKFDAAEMPIDLFDEEFGQEPVARTGARFWTFFSVALGAAVISLLAFAWSAADGRLRQELKSAVVAPVSARTHEGSNEEIDRLRRQVEALKNEITKLRDAGEQLAQMITALKAAEPETRAPVSSAYWYSDPTAMRFGIESQPEREGVVPLPRRSPGDRPASPHDSRPRHSQ